MFSVQPSETRQMKRLMYLLVIVQKYFIDVNKMQNKFDIRAIELYNQQSNLKIQNRDIKPDGRRGGRICQEVVK